MPRGRRPNPDAAKRAPLNLKTSAALRARVEESAAAAGLSLAQEVERVLLRSYDGEDSLGGPQTTAFVRLLAQVIQLAEARTGGGWTADFATWDVVRRLVEASIQTNRPAVPGVEAIRDVAAEIRSDPPATTNAVEQRLAQLETVCGPLDRATESAEVAAAEIAGLLRIVMRPD